MRVVLLSTYDLGRQPFGLASPAAWLRDAGHAVTCCDLAVGALPGPEVHEAELIGIYIPMHTATRLAAEAIKRVRRLNPTAHLCCYGLYAPMNADYLRGLGAQTILGGEFEPELEALASGGQPRPLSLDRIAFKTPDRAGLPVLARYPKLILNGEKRRVGYTEASRGCKHLCRHCPVVPVYEGTFRVVQAGVVLEDIRRQVDAGAQHITFGDPDFFNGPTHARRIVQAVHAEFPNLTYDVTIKIEHLLKHRDYLSVLKETGCLFITSAVESIEDPVLERLDKGHTRADFAAAVELTRALGIVLVPTFIPFTPWTTLDGYADLLRVVAELNLIESTAPVQMAIRLLIPSGSRLLELNDIQSVIGDFDTAALAYPWRHDDARVDMLASEVMRIVRGDTRDRKSRRETFRRIWDHLHSSPMPESEVLLPRTVIPYLEEPWFC